MGARCAASSLSSARASMRSRPSPTLSASASCRRGTPLAGGTPPPLHVHTVRVPCISQARISTSMHGLLCTSQELINLEAMRTLRLYHTQFQTLHAAPVSASTRGCTPEQQGGSTPELQRIEALLTRVEQTVGHASRQAHWYRCATPASTSTVQVSASHAEKSMAIIVLSEELTRRLHGVRVHAAMQPRVQALHPHAPMLWPCVCRCASPHARVPRTVPPWPLLPSKPGYS